VKLHLPSSGNSIRRLSVWKKKKALTTTGMEWRKLYRKELHNVYSSPDITRTIRSWRMAVWAQTAGRTHARYMKYIQYLSLELLKDKAT
jgi:hypothetical protein